MLDRDVYDCVGIVLSEMEAWYVYETIVASNPRASVGLVLCSDQGKVITSSHEIKGWELTRATRFFS